MGALTLHTGRNYILYYGHKNARSNYGEPTRLNQMEDIAKMVILLNRQNEYDFFEFEIIYVLIWYVIEMAKELHGNRKAIH